MATKDELEQENTKLKADIQKKVEEFEYAAEMFEKSQAEVTEAQERIKELEGKLEEVAANGGNDDALTAANERITDLEAKLEDFAVNGGDGALAYANDEIAALKSALTAAESELAQLKAAQDGSIAKDGGTEARSKKERGEEAPNWKKKEYNGPLTAEQAVWRLENIYNKDDSEKVETK